MAKSEYKETTSVNWNELFTRDVIEHLYGEREGGLGQWEYSTPNSETDLVQGSSLWKTFLKDHPEYYILDAEIALAKTAAPHVQQHITEPVALGFLGVGSKYAFKRKDLTVTQNFNRVVTATAFDLSTEYISQSLEQLEKTRPNSIRGGYIQNMFAGFDLPVAGSTKATRLATMFGLTLFNVDVRRDANHDLIMPEKAIRNRLRNIHQSLGKNGILITTHDANQDREKIENAYKGEADFAENLAHRIKRDTPYKTIDTNNVKFRVEWHPESLILGHYLTLDFNKGSGPQELLINSSPKIPLDIFKDWCKKEKLNCVESFENNGVYLHILQAV